MTTIWKIPKSWRWALGAQLRIERVAEPIGKQLSIKDKIEWLVHLHQKKLLPKSHR